MLSRAAESIYWMSRYLERAENVARFIEVNCHLMLDLPIAVKGQWEPLVLTTGDQDLFYENYETDNQANVIDFLTFNAENPNSILFLLAKCQESARSIQGDHFNRNVGTDQQILSDRAKHRQIPSAERPPCLLYGYHHGESFVHGAFSAIPCLTTKRGNLPASAGP